MYGLCTFGVIVLEYYRCLFLTSNQTAYKKEEMSLYFWCDKIHEGSIMPLDGAFSTLENIF